MNIVVARADTKSYRLNYGTLAMRCAVGRNGITLTKREGDGATPAGVWPLRRLFYRDDKVVLPDTRLSARKIFPNDGWCDAPADPHYNRLVRLPYPASAEDMWRSDDIYDFVVELGYNDDPVVPGKGSAIFLHVARPHYTGTAGCVAVELSDMVRLLSAVGPGTFIEIKG